MKKEFKRKLVYFVAILIALVAVSGCFKSESSLDKKEEVSVTENSKNITLSSENSIAGIEVKIQGKVEESKVNVSRSYLKIVKYSDDNTTISLAKIDSTKSVEILSLTGVKREDIISLKSIQYLNSEKRAASQSKNILLGDTNNDQVVNITDFIAFAAGYGLKIGDANYNSLCDISPSQKGTEPEWSDIYSVLTGDSIVGISDFITFASNYGKKAPETPVELFAVPNGFKVSSSTQNNISLSWEAAANASGYKLSRADSEGGAYSDIGGGSKIVINYKSSWGKVNIHYKNDLGTWTASPGVSMTGSNGTYSYEVNSKTLEFVFNDGNNNWDNNGSKNYKIDGYGIYSVIKDNAPQKTGEISGTLTATTYTDQGLTPAKKYYYKLKAIYAAGESDYTLPLSGETSSVPAQLKIYPYLTWNNNDMATNGVVVNYGTDVLCSAKVEYGTTETLDKSATGEDVKVNDNLYMHHVVLSGLMAGTKYYYRVVQGSTKSAIFNFKTAELNDKNYRFFMAGDMQDPGNAVQRWKDSVSAMKTLMTETPVDFFICSGDMPECDMVDRWVKFFELGRDIFPYLVFMPVLGNHDTDGTNIGKSIYDSNPTEAGVADFKKFFKYIPTETRAGIKSDGSYYSFNYGNAQFTSLNTEVTYMGGTSFKNDPQYAWAKDKITKEAANFTWNFSYWHIPAYNATEGHHDESYNIRPFTDFIDSKVDWVISGHVHTYQRIKPIRFDSKVKAEYGIGAEQGVGYLDLPPSGNVPREYVWKSDAEKATIAYPKNGDTTGIFAEVGFGLVDISDRTIDIKVYGLGNTSNFKPLHVIDEIKYSK